MTNTEEWQPFRWYCVNCGELVTGYRNNNGEIRAKCIKCGSVMVRIIKSRKSDTIKIHAPAGAQHI